MNLANLKIGTRLNLGFGMVVAVFAVLVCVAYVNFKRMSDANALNVYSYQVIDEVGGIMESLLNMETGERGFALTGIPDSLAPLEAGKAAFVAHLKKARELTSDNPKQQERLKAIEDTQRKWVADAIEPALKMRNEIIEGKTTIDNVLGFQMAGAGREGMDKMRALLLEVRNEESALHQQREQNAAALQTVTMATLIGGGIFAILLAAFLSAWTGRNIIGPLNHAVQVATKVAEGDLTVKVEVKSKDETGLLMQALRDMNDSLLKIVTEVRAGTDAMATASGEIAAGNIDLSSRTEHQASSLEETASSMEQLTSTVRQNAESAREANQLAVSASDVAVKGGEVVAQVVDTMGNISQSSKKIADITGVIDGIAFQTNILALNAAVEAARAGEQGRGFAVVASEVRSLAQRSAQAAKEIKALIGDSVEKVDVGSRLVTEAGATMDQVVGSVKMVTDIMNRIMAATAEQSDGIEHVNQAIAQMDQVTQQNAALVEQAAASAASMKERAESLAHAVSIFKLDGAQMAAGGPALPKPAAAAPASVLTPSAAVASSRRRAPPITAGSDWEEF